MSVSTSAIDIPDVYNGAHCRSYCWSQSHSDIEVHIKLTRLVKYEDINVIVTKDSMRVDLRERLDKKGSILASFIGEEKFAVKTLLDGCFEHPVHADSLCWLLDTDVPAIVLYLDKAEDMWWKQLLNDEEVLSSGPKNYVVSMDQMDDGSRMVIDKLIVDQRNKKIRNSRYSPV